MSHNNVNKDDSTNKSRINNSKYIQVPFAILADSELKPNEKLLYGVIKSYSKQTGYCFATNQYLAKVLGLARSTVSDLITGLKNNGYITTEDVYSNNWSYQFQRRIYLTDRERDYELTHTAHAGKPVDSSSTDDQETDTTYAKHEPPSDKKDTFDQDYDIGDVIDGNTSSNDMKGSLEENNPDREDINIIDNKIKELEIDNKKREIELEKFNSDLTLDPKLEKATLEDNSGIPNQPITIENAPKHAILNEAYNRDLNDTLDAIKQLRESDDYPEDLPF
ncbi:MAG: helix-turn-helix domain-containing protein [Fulvivirga sp.]